MVEYNRLLVNDSQILVDGFFRFLSNFVEISEIIRSTLTLYDLEKEFSP
jgi:hypothetical protein